MNSVFFIVVLGTSLKLLDITNAFRLKASLRNKRMADSSVEEFPYLVGLERYSDHWCSGAILSPYHIVTAAHCFDGREHPSAYQVRIGKQDGTLHEVQSYVVHEEYDIYGLPHHDVAVLRLEEPIELDNKLKKSIEMFESGEESRAGSGATLAGWASYGLESSQIWDSKLTIVDKKRCNDSWLNLGNHEGISEGQICASDLTESQSDCKGDSGSPLVINDKLAGILSLTYRCGSYMTVPTLFTEVAHFRNWIASKMTETNLAE